MELNQVFEETCFDIEYLVYSAHKTGTQSLIATLKHHGFKSLHCHRLRNIGLEAGSFKAYLDQYLQKNNQKLKVITIFRDPIERHISSFFQAYGSRPLRLEEVNDPSETLIYKHSVKRLQRKFIIELTTRSIMGYQESIHEICRELQISIDNFKPLDEVPSLYLYETENVAIYLMGFRELINNFESMLTEITQVPITSKHANMADQKWYKDVYHQFKESLVVPRKTISAIYNDKQDIINFIHSNSFETELNQAINKYAKAPTSGHHIFQKYLETFDIVWIEMRQKIIKKTKKTLKKIMKQH